MRHLTVLALATVALLRAQTSSGVSLSNGVRLRLTANLQQAPGQQTITPDIAPATGNSVYRVFRDQNHLAIFAYELAVDRTDDGERVRVIVKPAGSIFAAKFPNADGGKPTPTVPAPREFPALSSGQHADIELFDMPPNGKVSDTVEVTINQPGSPTPVVEANGRLRFSGLRVYINGALSSGSGARGAVSGRYTMFYIPRRGGYFFSTDPPEGRQFVKAGWVDRTRMQFSVDNETYDCVSDKPIFGDVDRGEIYVYHDPKYRPAGNLTRSTPTISGGGPPPDEFFMAAADSLNWWLP